jgi:hypothetical protein
MSGYLGFRHVSAERYGLTQAHWASAGAYKKAHAAIRLGRPGEMFTAGVHQVGARAWLGYSGWFTDIHVTGARTINQAIDLLEQTEAQRRTQPPPAGRHLAEAFGAP